uniref:Uncharacterized protein n=1 Tax=Anguilla anguilla TaxID=7936 RepID=A0A0E9QNC6_ANGAN
MIHMWLKCWFTAFIKVVFLYIWLSPCRNYSTFYTVTPFQGTVTFGTNGFTGVSD